MLPRLTEPFDHNENDQVLAARAANPAACIIFTSLSMSLREILVFLQLDPKNKKPTAVFS